LPRAVKWLSGGTKSGLFLGATERQENNPKKSVYKPGGHVLPSCYTRSTPSYKLISEYNLLLTQRLTSCPLVLGVLYCGSSSFARVTNELPLGVLWLLCVAGTSFARSTAQLSCSPLSLPTQLSESKAAAYIDNPAALTL
jgi:hypothetical protein